MSADEVMDAYPEPEEVEVPAAAPDAGAPQERAGTMTLQDEIALVLRQCEMTAARADALPPNYTEKPTIAEWRERVTWLSDVLRRTLAAWNDVRKTRHGGNVGTTPFYLFPYQCEPEYDQGHWVVVWYDDLYDLANPRFTVAPAAHQETPEPPPDVVCEHGVAMDVHCCNCHSGFIFDRHHQCPRV